MGYPRVKGEMKSHSVSTPRPDDIEVRRRGNNSWGRPACTSSRSSKILDAQCAECFRGRGTGERREASSEKIDKNRQHTCMLRIYVLH